MGWGEREKQGREKRNRERKGKKRIRKKKKHFGMEHQRPITVVAAKEEIYVAL